MEEKEWKKENKKQRYFSSKSRGKKQNQSWIVCTRFAVIRFAFASSYDSFTWSSVCMYPMWLWLLNQRYNFPYFYWWIVWIIAWPATYILSNSPGKTIAKCWLKSNLSFSHMFWTHCLILLGVSGGLEQNLFVKPSSQITIF